jgi:glycosyltransferase involved in cell wall biosynthesis
LQAARFGRRKGQEILIRAVADQVRMGRPWNVLLLGDGHDEGRCRRLVQALGIEDRVCFAGFQAAVENFMGAADVVVMPSYSEGLPRALLEGMAMGLCPVGSDIGGIREALEAPRYGFTFPAGNHRALGAVLTRLWRDEKLLRHTGRMARERIERRYPSRKLVSMHAKCYRDVLPQ